MLSVSVIILKYSLSLLTNHLILVVCTRISFVYSFNSKSSQHLHDQVPQNVLTEFLYL